MRHVTERQHGRPDRRRLLTACVGLLVAAVCGYMAGLIGSSNSLVSGVGLLLSSSRGRYPGGTVAVRPRKRTRRSLPTRCSPPRSCSALRRSRTITCRTSRRASWWVRPRGSSRRSGHRRRLPPAPPGPGAGCRTPSVSGGVLPDALAAPAGLISAREGRPAAHD